MSQSETPRTDAVGSGVAGWPGANSGTFAVMLEHARQLERELAAAQSATPDSDTAKDAELYRWLVRDTGALYSFVSVWLGTDSTEGNVDRAVKAAFSAWQRRNAALASTTKREGEG